MSTLRNLKQLKKQYQINKKEWSEILDLGTNCKEPTWEDKEEFFVLWENKAPKAFLDIHFNDWEEKYLFQTLTVKVKLWSKKNKPHIHNHTYKNKTPYFERPRSKHYFIEHNQKLHKKLSNIFLQFFEKLTSRARRGKDSEKRSDL